MRVLTIKTVESVSEEFKNEINHSFGMEHHTDYVFKDRDGSIYSATISLETTEAVILEIIEQSARFTDMTFIVEDLDSDNNVIERYKIENGVAIEHMKSDLEWRKT